MNLRSIKILPKHGTNNREDIINDDTTISEELHEMNYHVGYKSEKNISNDWKSLINIKKTASKWLHLAARRRSFCNSSIYTYVPHATPTGKQFYENLNSTLNGIASECESSDEDDEAPSTKHQENAFTRKLTKSSNKALLIYFSKLARSNNTNDELDLDFIESLIHNGADINVSDKYGQTIFHEVARTWHPDVGKFLLELNGNINQPDIFGRTPLHLAAAVNYPEMVKFLIDNGANPECQTFGELQTPVHYAAKNDANDSLQMLVKMKCNIEAKDSKNRTPLHTAAELDRSETAMYLVERNAQVGVVDKSGLSALALMIEKMPPVAKKALDQFHRTDRPNRKQYFFLNLLEPVRPGQRNVFAKTPMETLIVHKQMNLLLHPTFRQLISVKWNKFARTRHFLQICVQFLFVLLWSIVGATTPFDATAEYSNGKLNARWWRLALECIAIIFTLYLIVVELYEIRFSSIEHKKWKDWRIAEIEKDLKYCHPRWPEEKKYIFQELQNIRESKVLYFDDLWNILDWITYIWILAGVFARVFALAGDKNATNIHKRLIATSMIPIWLRLMKVTRVFQDLGPFIVMLGNILEDTLKFLFLYIEFFIPYIIAFWIIFGGNEPAQLMQKAGQTSDSWKSLNDLIYSVWLVTVVGDYNYDAISSVDKLMAQLLLGTYTAFSGILLLNLFIALMSDTFQRVHDNAKANALMQKAIAISGYQSSLSIRSKDRFLMFIHGQCAPQQIYYDDDDHDEDGVLEKMTIQIKRVVDDIKEMLEEIIMPSPYSDNREIRSTDDIKKHVNNTNEITNAEIIKLFTDRFDKHERVMESLDLKIDNLTLLVTQCVNKPCCNQTKYFSDSVSGADLKTATYSRLPSIYELKPDLFTPKRDTRTLSPTKSVFVDDQKDQGDRKSVSTVIT